MSIRKINKNGEKPKWEVRYHVAGRGSKRICRRFDTKSDAQAFFEERMFDKRQLKLNPQAACAVEDATLNTESDYWLKIQSPKFSPGHLKRVRCVLSKLLPRYGGMTVNEFHPALLTKIQSELLSSGLKPSSVNRDLEVILAILNFSVKHRRIPYSPAAGYEKLPEIRDDLDFWERHEAEDFLAFANAKYPLGSKNRWKYVAYLLALNTGLRAGEIWGLSPNDIKQEGELLHIQRQYDRLGRQFRPTKGKENRRVPCNASLLTELRTLLPRQKGGQHSTVFHRATGKPICHDNFKNRTFNRDLAEWGGKKVRFHDLRHTAITLMIAEGLDLKTVQEIAGHKEINTTMKYAHLLAEKIRFAAKTFSVTPNALDVEEEQLNLRLVK